VLFRSGQPDAEVHSLVDLPRLLLSWQRGE